MITESSSNHDHLEKKSVSELLHGINSEDKTVAYSVEKALPQIERLLDELVLKIQAGGRLFYIGAGTSGRLGVVDASECPPTFGVPHGMVIGLIAGGDSAIRKAVEFAEDDAQQAWIDLKTHQISTKDCVIGIAASGRTPYVIGGIQEAKKAGCLTGAITCNPNSALAQAAEFPIEVVVGPEYVSGSTRMKAGTAQKMVLNLISTTLMIQLGRVKGNKMVDMQLSNQKLIERGTRMIAEELGIDPASALTLLEQHGSVRAAINAHTNAQH